MASGTRQLIVHKTNGDGVSGALLVCGILDELCMSKNLMLVTAFPAGQIMSRDLVAALAVMVSPWTESYCMR